MIFNLSGTMGPTIGGFLTDTLSWHWLFLVNIVPGLLVAAVVWVTIDIDKPDFSLLRGFDLTGLTLMAVFLGCLQYALEEGPRRDWLDEATIRAAVIISAVGGSLFFTGPTAFDMRAPLRNIAELKGKKVRVLASPFQTEQIARLGATGVPRAGLATS